MIKNEEKVKLALSKADFDKLTQLQEVKKEEEAQVIKLIRDFNTDRQRLSAQLEEIKNYYEKLIEGLGDIVEEKQKRIYENSVSNQIYDEILKICSKSKISNNDLAKLLSAKSDKNWDIVEVVLTYNKFQKLREVCLYAFSEESGMAETVRKNNHRINNPGDAFNTDEDRHCIIYCSKFLKSEANEELKNYANTNWLYAYLIKKFNINNRESKNVPIPGKEFGDFIYATLDEYMKKLLQSSTEESGESE